MRFTSTITSLLTLALVACGGGSDGGSDSDDTPGIDAAPTPDSAPPDAAPPDPTSSYDPEPLADGDLTPAELEALAVRFNPAQVFTNDVLFSSPVDYVLAEGGPLMRGEITEKGPYWAKVDPMTITEVMDAGDLLVDDWSDLPLMAESGKAYAYFIDTPGDNTAEGADAETWTAEWTAAGGPGYTPTQYAHFFWLSKPDGYLAIQYWFFYPYNKFANSHEGDWEHMNVIVQKPAGGDWAIVMAHYSFHARQAGLLAADMVRVADQTPGGDGDHPVVFTGGEGCQMFGIGTTPWCGNASGASFPYPGLYTAFAAPETAAGGTLAAGHVLHANEFEVVILPRLDQPVAGKLSWYKLPFFAGQLEVLANAPAVQFTNAHRAPIAPGAGHFEFEEAIPNPYDLLMGAMLDKFTVPAGWTMINDPTQSF